MPRPRSTRAALLMALCGSVYRLANDVTRRHRNLRDVSWREVVQALVGACVRREPALQHSPAFIRWAAAKTQ